jgi:hypothetical protein
MTAKEVGIVGVAAFGGAVVAGFALVVFEPKACTSGTPSPADLNITITDPTDPNQRADVLRYGRRLRFKQPPNPDHALAVPVRDTNGNPTGAFRYGPLGQARPEECAHKNDLQDLVEGRIVAHVRIRANNPQDWPDPARPGYLKGHYADHDNDGTPDFEWHDYFPNGWSYVWIDQLGSPGQDGSRPARALIFEDKPNGVMHEVWVTWTPHDEHEASFAAWVPSPDDDHLWQSCSSMGCCTVRGDGPG